VGQPAISGSCGMALDVVADSGRRLTIQHPCFFERRGAVRVDAPRPDPVSGTQATRNVGRNLQSASRRASVPSFVISLALSVRTGKPRLDNAFLSMSFDPVNGNRRSLVDRKTGTELLPRWKSATQRTFSFRLPDGDLSEQQLDYHGGFR
jgi:hypothetical protein